MQRIVIIANGAAYGSESLFNSLRSPLPCASSSPTSISSCF